MRFKAIPLIAVLVVSSILLVSCGGTVEGTIRKYFSGCENMDMGIIRSTIHPDSSMYERYSNNEFNDLFVQGGVTGEIEVTVDELNVTEQTDDSAMVTVKTTTSMVGGMGSTITQTIELRKHGNQWLIYDFSA